MVMNDDSDIWNKGTREKITAHMIQKTC
jgi:hypothetical protein